MTKFVEKNDIQRMKQEDSRYGERMKQTARKITPKMKNPVNYSRMSASELLAMEDDDLETY